jgi:hypothetical protein
MSRRAVILLVTFVTIGVGALAYAAGFSAGRAAPAAAPASKPIAQPVQSPDPFMPPPQFQAPQPFQGPQPAPAPAPGQQSPPNLREFVPMPGPGQQMPGQQQQQGDCQPVILFYYNGQLYELRPAPGPQNGPGRPAMPPEFFHLNPYQGPAIPGLPFPQPDRAPGITPANPRS